MAALIYVLQWRLLNQMLGDDLLPPLLVTFGLSVIAQSALLDGYSADAQKMDVGALETASIAVGGLTLGVLPLPTFAAAVSVIWRLQWTFYHTAMGRAFRAVSSNKDIAQLMGLKRRHVFGLAMALALEVTAIAGILPGFRTSFDPSIGGLGNLSDALAGGMILGVAQTIGAKIDPGWQILSGHTAFLIILAALPNGLFPRING